MYNQGNADYCTAPEVSSHKAQQPTMLNYIVIVLIFASAANASRLDIIGGKDVETPGM